MEWNQHSHSIHSSTSYCSSSRHIPVLYCRILIPHACQHKGAFPHSTNVSARVSSFHPCQHYRGAFSFLWPAKVRLCLFPADLWMGPRPSIRTKKKDVRHHDPKELLIRMHRSCHIGLNSARTKERDRRSCQSRQERRAYSRHEFVNGLGWSKLFLSRSFVRKKILVVVGRVCLFGSLWLWLLLLLFPFANHVIQGQIHARYGGQSNGITHKGLRGRSVGMESRFVILMVALSDP